MADRVNLVPPSAGETDVTGRDAARPLGPGLWVVATPLGNLGDLSPRALQVLCEADILACEDTRVTGRLLRGRNAGRLLVYNDHSAERVRPLLLAHLRDGRSVALCSDAGTPCISDPGYKLVRAAHEDGIAVRAVPGPSAISAALSIAGLPTDRFFYLGILSSRATARRTALAEIAALKSTLVLLEAPHRLAACLADAAAVLGQREAAIAREISKLHEEVRRGPLADLAAHYAVAPTPRGEVVVIIGPPSAPPAPPESSEVDALLIEAAAMLAPRPAAARVAALTGLPSNELYARLLALRRGTRPVD